MSSRHIALQGHNDHFDFTVLLESTPELETLIRGRMALAATTMEKDDHCTDLVFSFYDFEVYENLDLGDDVAVLDELPELGTSERVDYGELVINSENVRLRFGIKHVPGVNETSAFTSALFDEDS